MAKTTSKPKATLNRVTPADWIRLGPDVAKVKSQMTPARWRQVVNAAHGQGWTVSSALDSSTPAALKQKTQSSLQKAAKKTIDTAYAPQTAELDYADQQNSGLRAKRLSDQAAYDQWSSQKAAELAGGINAAQAKYLDTIKASTDAAKTQAGTRQATLAAQANQGAVGDMSQSIAVRGAAERAAASGEKADNTYQAAAAQTPIVATRAAAVQLADVGGAQARHGQIEGMYNKAASDIFSGRLKMASDRASDQIKEYSSLLKTEMDKASSNRDFQGLQAQISSKADIAAMKHQEFLTGQAGLNSRAAGANATTRRGQDKSAASRAADRGARATQGALNRALKLQTATVAQTGKSTGPAAVANSRKAIQSIHTLADVLKNKRKVLGADGKQHSPTRAMLINMGFSNDSINVALRVARGAHGAGAIRNPQVLNILPSDVGLI